MRTRSNYYYDHYEGLFYDDGEVFEDPDFPNVNHEAQRELMAYSEGQYEDRPSREAVRERAQNYSKNIFASYHQLNKILERHEATIQRRWMKKPRQQRLQILLKYWPDMPASHRPDFAAFRQEHAVDRHEHGSKLKDHFMWPIVNQEDLSGPKLMLLLLNSRGRLAPPAFAAVDYEGLWFGKATRGLHPEFLHYHTMIMHGATNAEEYGKLVHWESHPDAEEWVKTRRQLLPGDGLLVLEVQDRLMKFLVDCCHQILHEIPPDVMISDEYPIQPEPTLKTDSDASGFVSLAVITAEAPYKQPAGLDLRHLLKVLEAKMSAAQDHIWSLREDPAYFSEQFREYLDHREEMLPDTNGKPHPVTQPHRINTLWSRVLLNMVVHAYSNLQSFAILYCKVLECIHYGESAHNDIDPAKDLPQTYFYALTIFKFYLDQSVMVSLEQLEHSEFASPPIRKFFARMPPPDPYTSDMNVIPRAGVKITGVDKEVMFLIQTLWKDDWGLFIARLPLVVDELERLMQANPKADALISAHVAKILGDIAIIAQCLKQLELYQPWAAQFDETIQSFTEIYRKSWKNMGPDFGQLHDAFLRKEFDEAARLAEPSGGKFTYPYSKRRTKETVDTMRRAEANLDIVWAKIDQITKKNVTGFEDNVCMVYRMLSGSRTLRRTPEWVEPIKSDSKAESITKRDLWELNKPLSKLFLDEPAQEPKKFKPEVKSKTKVKTKREQTEPATAEEATLPAVIAEPEPEATQPTFAVDAKALKVFRTLFFDPEVTSTPGLIPWNDFLYAMAATGFKIEKLYGSVWQFTPTKLDVERSIHFHEPHPMGKIPFETARRHGRRLARAYGWHGDFDYKIKLIEAVILSRKVFTLELQDALTTVEQKQSRRPFKQLGSVPLSPSGLDQSLWPIDNSKKLA
ncbi:hypothetical protein FPANT_639 [Fusarium pseudoanthophilum]|uniref:Clr5 domain-containing protein n=1 Tax=Fusarium pseudoanthophilum TaxID=48495 RepID=A0A8H5Q3A9_9HYPO|nr:hypothetical protein FPANT_639 [Fusarium pseudoanthophilum]